MKRYLFLGIGIVLSVAFVVAAYLDNGGLYEQLYYERAFSQEMMELGLYPTLALITVALTWGIAVLYYYVINSVNFDRWWHWAVMLLLAALVTPTACYAVSDAALAQAGVDYTVQLGQFEMQHVIWAAVLFSIASMAIRWWSTNCRHTPFPQ